MAANCIISQLIQSQANAVQLLAQTHGRLSQDYAQAKASTQVPSHQAQIGSANQQRGGRE